MQEVMAPEGYVQYNPRRTRLKIVFIILAVIFIIVALYFSITYFSQKARERAVIRGNLLQAKCDSMCPIIDYNGGFDWWIDYFCMNYCNKMYHKNIMNLNKKSVERINEKLRPLLNVSGPCLRKVGLNKSFSYKSCMDEALRPYTSYADTTNFQLGDYPKVLVHITQLNCSTNPLKVTLFSEKIDVQLENISFSYLSNSGLSRVVNVKINLPPVGQFQTYNIPVPLHDANEILEAVSLYGVFNKSPITLDYYTCSRVKKEYGLNASTACPRVSFVPIECKKVNAAGIIDPAGEYRKVTVQRSSQQEPGGFSFIKIQILGQKADNTIVPFESFSYPNVSTARTYCFATTNDCAGADYASSDFGRVHFANFTRAGVAFSMRGPDGWDIKCDSDGTFVDCV